MLSYSRPWFDRWVESATGSDGFWPDNLPEQHFRTASTTGAALIHLITPLLDQHLEIRAVVDIGAGGGELLTRLAELRPGLSLTGVDLRSRPNDLPDAVAWVRDRWDVRQHHWTGPAAPLLGGLDRPTLVIAGEWLDDLPAVVAQRVGDGWRELLVDDSGRETAGPTLPADDRDWLQRWWPSGQRAEVGRTRDRAWAELVGAVLPYGGLALLIDYGHLTSTRPAHGSLTGYRAGRQVPPLPTGSVNLTAHVAIDAVRAAGEARGATTLRCARQRDVVRESPPLPSSSDPLIDLAGRSQRAALAASPGLGAHWWLLQR